MHTQKQNNTARYRAMYLEAVPPNLQERLNKEQQSQFDRLVREVQGCPSPLGKRGRGSCSWGAPTCSPCQSQLCHSPDHKQSTIFTSSKLMTLDWLKIA